MNEFLVKIKEETELRVQQFKQEELLQRYIETHFQVSNADFFTDLNKHSINVIAEIKYKSPALGVINPKAEEAANVAGQYLAHGAFAISVLTEPTFFNGTMNNLYNVRKAYPAAKILMKDFIIDKYQLLLAQACGANAVLLIAGFLQDKLLRELYHFALERNLIPLVEVHNIFELKLAENLNCKFIGINNRNLQTLKVDINNCIEVIKHRTKDAIFIAESGIKSREYLLNLKEAGFAGALIGGYLMQHDNPGLALRNLTENIV